MFPETVFLQNGVPVELIKSDPETGHLHSFKQQKYLKQEYLIKTMTQAHKEQRHENASLVDMAIFRHNYDFRTKISSNPFVKLVSFGEFAQLMSEKLTNPMWKSLELVQTCIKAKFGIGKHIPIDFKMTLGLQEEQNYFNELNKKIT